MMPSPSTPPMPIYWLRVPHEVMKELRSFGFHDGNTRDSTMDVDCKLLMSFHPRMPLAGKKRHFKDWLSRTYRECVSMRKGFPTIWNPFITAKDAEWLQADIRVIVIQADTVEGCFHLFYQTKWVFGVFYHVACIGDWKEVVLDQLDLLENANLRCLYVSFLGSKTDLRFFRILAKRKNIEIIIGFYSDDVLMYEIPAMRMIANWAKEHPTHYLLYFHTKGVSVPGDYVKRRWRLLMEKWVVQKWRLNYELLRKDYEAVGVSWRDAQPVGVAPIGHFPGNFFMAKSSFILALEEFEDFYKNPRHEIKSDPSWRYQAEMWLGSSKRPTSIYSHATRDQPIDRLCRITAI